MFKKKNILEHCGVYEDQTLTPPIQPIKTFIPEWYKKSARYMKKGEDGYFRKISKTDVKSLPISPGLKFCIPFLESMVTGYAIPLPFDIMVQQTTQGPIISWQNEEDFFAPVSQRFDTEATLVPTPPGYAPNHFVWLTKNIMNIPKGFSAIIGQPFNRFDLPFMTLTGIVDSGVLHEGNLPFFIKQDFEGTIPAGTPIAQVILFNKENWTSKVNSELQKEATKNSLKSKVAFFWYKNNVYQKRSYD